MTNGPTRKRSAERNQFLTDCLTGAIEHAGYGFPGIIEYKWEGREEDGTAYAIIYDRYEDDALDCATCGKPVTSNEWTPDGELFWHIDGYGTCNDGKLHEPTHVYLVTVDTIAHGLGIMQNAKQDTVNGATVYVNAVGQPLGADPDTRRNIVLANRTDGVDGDIDVIGYLAILECAIFGRVRYA